MIAPTRFLQWLYTPQDKTDDELLHAYYAFANSPHGQTLMQHWAQSTYMTVYEGKDPVELSYHNGRRSMLAEIFTNCDMARNPQKYRGEIKE
jgi:hypothetical protein